MAGFLGRAAWQAAASVPLALVCHELLVGVLPGPVGNAGGDFAAVLVKRTSRPSVGDVVAFENPFAPGSYALARVTGVPGDVYMARGMIMRLHPGQVWLTAADDADDRELAGDAADEAEGETLSPPSDNTAAQAAAESNLPTAAGDKPEPLDSAAFGPLPVALVGGVALACITRTGGGLPSLHAVTPTQRLPLELR